MKQSWHINTHTYIQREYYWVEYWVHQLEYNAFNTENFMHTHGGFRSFVESRVPFKAFILFSGYFPWIGLLSKYSAEEMLEQAHCPSQPLLLPWQQVGELWIGFDVGPHN